MPIVSRQFKTRLWVGWHDTTGGRARPPPVSEPCLTRVGAGALSSERPGLVFECRGRRALEGPLYAPDGRRQPFWPLLPVLPVRSLAKGSEARILGRVTGGLSSCSPNRRPRVAVPAHLRLDAHRGREASDLHSGAAGRHSRAFTLKCFGAPASRDSRRRDASTAPQPSASDGGRIGRWFFLCFAASPVAPLI